MLRICGLLVVCGLPVAGQRRNGASVHDRATADAAGKNRRRQNDAKLDQVATRGSCLAHPGTLAGTLLGRVLHTAPAP